MRICLMSENSTFCSKNPHNKYILITKNLAYKVPISYEEDLDAKILRYLE